MSLFLLLPNSARMQGNAGSKKGEEGIKVLNQHEMNIMCCIVLYARDF